MKPPIFRVARHSINQSGFRLVFTACWLLTVGVLPAQSEQVLDLSGLTGTAPAESTAIAGSGSGIVNLNQFLGANRYYNHSTPITGQGSITYNLEAGHIWNGHEALGHVTQYSQTGDNLGVGVEPLFDRHATWVGMLIGGGKILASPLPYQTGMAPQTDLRSAALATSWIGLNTGSFNYNANTFLNAFNASFGVADVVNSSWGFFDPSGADNYTVAMDAYAWEQTGTTFVASAGNSGPGTNTIGSPGSGYNNITVGALTKGTDPANPYNSVADFSSRSPQSFRYYDSNTATFTTINGVRAAVDIAAPGDNITSAYYGGATGQNTGGSNVLTANLYSMTLQGTSFAAPLVAGGAALMASAADTLPQLIGNPNAKQSMVVKSLLLTGADKTAGWSNGLATVTESGNTFLRTTQSLDWAVGAGRMNLDTTFDLQLNGTRDVAGTATGLLGQVASKGWDYGWANRGVNNDYVFSTPFDGMSQFVTTLSWQRVREIEVAEVFDIAQANLTVSFWSLDSFGAFDKLIAESASLYNTVEHLSFEVPATGRYGLRVSYPNNTFDTTTGGVWGSIDGLTNYYQEYGIAWSMTPVPETSTLLPLAAMFCSSLCLRVRRRVRAC